MSIIRLSSVTKRPVNTVPIFFVDQEGTEVDAATPHAIPCVWIDAAVRTATASDTVVDLRAKPSLKLALVDTGADRSFISKRLLDQFELPPICPAVFQGANGSSNGFFYPFAVRFPGIESAIRADVGAIDFPNLRCYDFIVGMDVLRLGRLVMDFASKDFRFTFGP